MKTQELYRPVGLFELRLIREANYQAFPPRLTHQPLFYPVLNVEYAEQIARHWNTNDEASGFMGAVTAFDVDTAYLSQFEEHVVGSSIHREFWIPAEELDEFNRHIQGTIRVLKAFYGERFSGKREW
jgi:predicted hydrolase (HD superfamily)